MVYKYTWKIFKITCWIVCIVGRSKKLEWTQNYVFFRSNPSAKIYNTSDTRPTNQRAIKTRRVLSFYELSKMKSQTLNLYCIRKRTSRNTLVVYTHTHMYTNIYIFCVVKILIYNNIKYTLKNIWRKLYPNDGK